jgi:hypothetical protein
MSSAAARGTRAAWILGASLAAALGLGWALNERDQGQSWANLGSLARYALVAFALIAVGYAIHRAVFRQAGARAWQEATLDVLIAVLIIGPAILFLILLVSTVRECSFGPGC